MGFAYGVVQSSIPGGWGVLSDLAGPPSKDSDVLTGKAAGNIAVGAGEIVAGAAGTIGGVATTPEGVGVPLAAAGVVLTEQGILNVGVGVQTLQSIGSGKSASNSGPPKPAEAAAADARGDGGRAARLAPAESKVWKSFKSAGEGRRTSGSGKAQRYYEWDHTRGDIEVYDSKGRHLGSMEPTTGEMYKPPVKGRTIGL